MKKVSTNRKVTIITLFAIVIVMALFTAISFSFLEPEFVVGPSYTTYAAADNLIITYTDCKGDKYSCMNVDASLKPGESLTKDFTVSTNGAQGKAYFKVMFKELQNTFTNKSNHGSDIVYKLEKIDEDGNIITKVIDNVELTYTNETILEDYLISDVLSINSGEVGIYRLTFTFRDYMYSQAYNENAFFNAKVTIAAADASNKPNAPKLVSNLIPVVYDEIEDVWRKSSANSEDWYDYDSQKWANAVTVSESSRQNYIAAEIGAPIFMNDIISMYVWIPRFEYKIGGREQEISVKFINRLQTVPDTGYIIHPAFTDGSYDKVINGVEYPAWSLGGWDQETSGFWWGKFEAGNSSVTSGQGNGSATNIVTKPNAVSMRSMNVSAQKTAAENAFMRDGINKNDLTYHMSKNDEWGAVAYLTQSAYGKYGNEHYSGVNKELYINNYFGSGNTVITGVSGGSYGLSQANTIAYRYNDITYVDDVVGARGAGASTTGNIYGAYDMSGGAWEYQMANYLGTVASSGFSAGWYQTIDHKFYNWYTTSNATTACQGKPCLGHALNETSGWYGDYANMVTSSYPWALRGGWTNDSSGAGVFAFYRLNGGAYGDYGFRVVLT